MISSRNTQYAIRNRITFYALVATVLLGFAVRLWDLDAFGVWFDEAYHVQLVRLPTAGDMLNAVLSNPPSDPLYVLVLRLWVALFGHGDGAIRMLSVIFSTATIPATYWLGRTLLGYRAGLLGALFLAVSPYAVEFGQEAALYALASLATTLALAAGWHWRETGTIRTGLLYVGLGIIAIYSHYVVAVILGLFAILGLIRWAGPRKVSGRAWIVAHVAIFATWLPWLIPLILYWLHAEVPRATLHHTAEVSEIGGALTQFSSGTATLLSGVRPIEWAGLLLGAVLLGLGWAAGRQPDKRGIRVLLAISTALFFIPWMVSAVTGLWLFVPHFMLFLLPTLFIALAGGLSLLWTPLSRNAHHSGITHYALRSIFPTLLAGWVLVQLLGLVLYYRHPPHGADGLRELAATLKSEMQAGDTVLVTPPILTPTLQQYYEGPLRGLPSDFDLRAVYLPYEKESWQAGLASALNASAQGHPRFWLVYRSEQDEGGRFLRDVQARSREVEHKSYEFAELYLFEY